MASSQMTKKNHYKIDGWAERQESEEIKWKDREQVDRRGWLQLTLVHDEKKKGSDEEGEEEKKKKEWKNDIQDSESNKNHIWFPHQEGSSPWNAGRMALTSYSKYT